MSDAPPNVRSPTSPSRLALAPPDARYSRTRHLRWRSRPHPSLPCTGTYHRGARACVCVCVCVCVGRDVVRTSRTRRRRRRRRGGRRRHHDGRRSIEGVSRARSYLRSRYRIARREAYARMCVTREGVRARRRGHSMSSCASQRSRACSMRSSGDDDDDDGAATRDRLARSPNPRRGGLHAREDARARDWREMARALCAARAIAATTVFIVFFCACV